MQQEESLVTPLLTLHPEAAEKIKQHALSALALENHAKVGLSISPHVYPEGHMFHLVDSKMTVRQQAALVFVDHMPGANWGHPCAYHFYNPQTGEPLYQENAIFPPNLAKAATPFEQFHVPVTNPVVARPSLQLANLISRANFFIPSPSQVIEQRYAILWTSQISNLRHVEDLEFLWRALVNLYGFSTSNIYVLCYDGSIGATDVTGAVGNWSGNNTPYQMKVHGSATVANLQAVFNELAGKLKPKDLLLIHTNNHGSPSGLCVDNSSVIAPTDFGKMLSGLPAYRSLVVSMEQCYSGAFKDPVLQKSSAVNTVFASAVPADKTSDGAAHFDPWALAWIEAITGTIASGSALASPPAQSLDGLVSMKASFDWAKANDTGKDDDPQYGDHPGGCGCSMYLGIKPQIPSHVGDVNGDGRAEIVVTSPWGIGVLEEAGSTMNCLMLAPNGTRFGGWLLNTGDNQVGPVADFDGDGKAEIFISSPWGIGVLKFSGTTLTSPMMAQNGTRFGSWLLNTADNTFGPVADFNGDGKPEILVRSPWGIGILELAGNTMHCLMLQPNGTRFGGWLLETYINNFGPAAKLNGGSKAGLFVSSPWGIGILELSGNTMVCPMMHPNGTRFGGWLLDTSNNNFGRVGDYDGDGVAEILVSSPWGLGLLKQSGSTMSCPMLQPNGTRFGGWLLETSQNAFGPAADYDGDGKAEVLVYSAWGVGILKLAGNTMSCPMLKPNGTRFGGWLLNTNDNEFGSAASYQGGKTAEVVITSPWGLGILKLSGNTMTAPMMQPNGTRFGGWLLNTADNQF